MNTTPRRRVRRPLNTTVAAMVTLSLLVPGLTPGAEAQSPERLAGPDRFATAVAVSTATFPSGAEVAYVATGENFPDALAGGPLAGSASAPILLTGRDALPAVTASEVRRLQVSEVRVLGGAPAVSDAVVAELGTLVQGSVRRIEGPNRFATAAAISTAGFAPGADEVFVATGANFPDALAGSAVGAARGIPVLLTNPASVPTETAAELQRLSPGRITVLGSADVVSDAVLGQLQAFTDGEVRRLAGTNRFATAAAIALDAYPSGAPVVFLATGANFPDALSGAPAAGLAEGPLLLVNQDCAPVETVQAVSRLAPARLVVLGGEPAVSTAAASLQPCGEVGGGEELTPPSFEVDGTLVPDTAELPPRVPGDAPRPVARLADTLGTAVDFAEAELVVMADEAELQGLLERWDGELLITHDPGQLDQLDPVHVVRIDPALADPADLSGDARVLDPLSTGAHAVSTGAGLGTLAASLSESAGGMVVGLNALDRLDAIADGTTAEAGTGQPIDASAYSADAFTWPYMDPADPMGIGIAEAWQLLEAAGVRDRVQVGIVDDGFGATDDDRPANSVGLGSGFGSIGVIGCGSPPMVANCPFHGHNVASAAAAVPDNDRGAAGSGGTAARLVMVQRGRGVDGTIAAFLDAANSGAEIINMSFGWTMPAATASTLDPVRNVMDVTALHHNRLLIASAGNAGANIDAMTCGPDSCWEDTLYAPCEFDGVMCVGGVSTGTRNAHGNSNYGAGSLDVFGPFTVYVGGDPATPGNLAQVVSGTSFAAPIVAGTAAMMWAAYRSRPPFTDPSHHEVRRAIIETANLGTDTRVTRVLDAPAAVRRALGAGTGSAPVVQLGVPTTLTVPYGADRGYTATASDPEDGPDCCTLRWTSDVDGLISTARTFLYAFPSPGVRTLSVVATDSSGTQSAPQTVRVDAVNNPPEVTWTRPDPTRQLRTLVDYPFVGTFSDVNEPSLGCFSLTWRSTAADAGAPVSGCRTTVRFFAAGPRTLTLTGVDSLGAETVISRDVIVTELRVDEPPVVQILEPDPGSSYTSGTAVPLKATATVHPDKTTPVSYQWTATSPRGTTEVATTLDATYTCNVDPSSPGGSVETHTLVFTATDVDGSSSESVAIDCVSQLR